MENKTMYKCAICGGAYDSIAQRTNCEQTCLKKKEEEERKAAELKKAAEYETRHKEVDMAFDHAYKLKDQFLKDYGHYSHNQTVSNSGDLYIPFSWLWERM